MTPAQRARELKREATLDRNRQLLREYEAEDITYQELGKRHGCHTSTAWRWCDDARWARREYEKEMAKK